MKGLILKDFYSLKVYVKTLFIMVALYALLGIFTDSPSMLSGLIGVFCMILPVTSFSYDKYFKWEEFALSLPLRRAKIVLAKYIFTALLVLFSMVFITVFSILIELFSAQTISMDGAWELLMTNYFTMGIFLLLPAILLPVMFKFGPDKGRVALIAVLGGFSLLIVAAAQFLPSLAPELAQSLKGTFANEHNALAVLNIIPIVTIVLFILSYFLSCAFYRAREV